MATRADGESGLVTAITPTVSLANGRRVGINQMLLQGGYSSEVAQATLNQLSAAVLSITGDVEVGAPAISSSSLDRPLTTMVAQTAALIDATYKGEVTRKTGQTIEASQLLPAGTDVTIVGFRTVAGYHKTSAGQVCGTQKHRRTPIVVNIGESPANPNAVNVITTLLPPPNAQGDLLMSVEVVSTPQPIDMFNSGNGS